MLFPLNPLYFGVLINILASLSLAADLKAVMTKPQEQEALKIKEEAIQHIHAHQKEILDKAKEARKVVEKIIEEDSSLPSSSCLIKRPNSSKKCGVQKIENQDFKSLKTNDSSRQLIVFISFSMPKESLKALFKETENNPSLRLVMRGLIDDSMEKTAQKINELEGVVDIDPEIFDTYHIEAVPTFLWLDKGEPLAKLSGNITLSYAKELFDKERKPS